MLRVNFFYYVALFTVVFQSDYLFTMEKIVKPSVLLVTGEFPKQEFLNLIPKGLIDNGIEVAIWSSKKNSLDGMPNYVRGYLSKVQWTDSLPSNEGDFNIKYAQYGDNGAMLAELKKQGELTGHIVTHWRGSHEEELAEYDELIRQGRLNLTVCKSFESMIVEKWGIPRKTVMTGHSAMNLKKFDIPNMVLKKTAKLECGSAFRFESKKMPLGLLKAVARYNKSNRLPKIFYTMAGDGPLKEKAEKLVEELGIADCVKMPGKLSQEAIIKMLSQLHVFFCPSVVDPKTGDRDGIQNAAKEAMAIVRRIKGEDTNGIPQVARPICITTRGEHGMGELIKDKETGLMVEANDPDAIVGGLDWLMKNPGEWKRLADNSYREVQKFDSETVYKDLARTFRELVNVSHN